MKKLSILLAAVIFFGGLILMTGCSQRDSELVGVWVFEDDPSWVTTFEEGGDGHHAIDWGYGLTFTWSTSSNNIYWNYPGHDQLYTAYNISNDVLTITTENGTNFRYIRN